MLSVSNTDCKSVIDLKRTAKTKERIMLERACQFLFLNWRFSELLISELVICKKR
jgi:hypothetical protein